jgi:integrase
MRRMAVDWSRTNEEADSKPALIRYESYLRKIGLKDNTITLYLRLINNYLKELNTNLPLPEDAERFYESLHQRKSSRSAINNFAAAIIKYQEMIGKHVKIRFLRLNNSLPYYFDEMDILAIFDACHNFKHLCMLMTLFFGCLRSAELCNLDVGDYDSHNLTLKLGSDHLFG